MTNMTQSEALAILKTGVNAFLTGEPGSGKTHTINQYVAYLRSAGIEPAITASTGIAATHIGGLTIHAWSGIGVRRELSAYDLDRLSQNRTAVRRIGQASILIIDEVSMLSARALLMVDQACQEIRRNREPFGGLQVILVGDFFQLPPVSRPESDLAAEQFAFRSAAWDRLKPIVCYLSEQHRQANTNWLDLLSAIRAGTFADNHRQLLRSRYAAKPTEGITQLYSHNADVDLINEGELAKLSGPAKTYTMEANGPEKLVAPLKRGCLSPETLALKVGARVMFTKNDITSRRYVNGTLGTVIDFAPGEGWPIIKTVTGKTIVAEAAEWHIEDGDRVLARIKQVPLRLAWAITVHKSQGMSLDTAHMDLSQTFEYGQGYVALSRLRTLKGLSLAGLNGRALEVHPEISREDKRFRAESTTAGEQFAALPIQELETMHANFIRACGGRAGRGRQIKPVKKRGATYHETKMLLVEQLSLAEIAERRGLTVETIIGHLEKLAQSGQIDPKHNLAYLNFDTNRLAIMTKALKTIYQQEKKMPLAPALALLDPSYTYRELRLARLFIKPSAPK